MSKSTTTGDIEPTTCSPPKHKRQRIKNNNADDDNDDNDNNNDEDDTKINLYKGWTVPESNYQIPILISTEEDTITPERFYEDFIRHRRPVVIRGKKLPNELKNLDRWKTSNKIIIDRAGDEFVMVEKRSHDSDSFGKGDEISMNFRKFMKLIEHGDNMHYLTTQDVMANTDGRPELMAKFMKKLQGGNNDTEAGNNTVNFPLRPNIAGNLIPQNINLWIGNSKDGTSSGLHHDYHDNFYIVLRGIKRFRLFSPADTEKMYTRCPDLVKVHRNGRINYKGEVTTAYGADIEAYAAAKAAKAKDDAEERLVKAEKGVEEGRPGAQEELELAETLLDEAMDAILDTEMDSNVDEEEEQFHLEHAKEGDADGIDLDIMSSSSDDDDDTNNDDNISDYHSNSCHIVDKTVKNPNNFSKVEQSILDDDEKLKQDFPQILEANSAFCECHAGDILYLPASWFHEVRSFSDGNSSKSNNNNDKNNNGHMAFNYWFHPPDADNDFEHPYTTDFWPNDFKNRSA